NNGIKNSWARAAAKHIQDNQRDYAGEPIMAPSFSTFIENKIDTQLRGVQIGADSLKKGTGIHILTLILNKIAQKEAEEPVSKGRETTAAKMARALQETLKKGFDF
ncbi:MAG: hypothetical protein AAF244_03610, partial [Pseudomonadota bacterium]